ncbi:hypothetical protein PC110_g12994 [Phytophthora cactorum]|uniref:Uncharacterized protein n=1 Tax=Phytophthora cactorum TaxID=29920 RepID=A0A329S135_9STRA|nr:hypothetical protein PC110_g12994 [Phytophthora cactorum]
MVGQQAGVASSHGSKSRHELVRTALAWRAHCDGPLPIPGAKLPEVGGWG